MSKTNVLVRHIATALVCIIAVSSVFAVRACAQTNVLTQHNDNNRDGLNATETVLHPSNVSTSQFGLLFKVAVDDQVYAQPLYMSSMSIAGGTHNVVFIATTNNSVYAFDADSGTEYWHVQLGTAFKVQDIGFNCTDVLATSGIMSTPVIDPTTNTLYVVTETWNGSSANHQLHALNLATGTDRSGSPVTLLASGFNSNYQNQRAALLLSGGNIYIGFASHCDQYDYAGYTMAYSASSLAQVGVFNAGPDDNAGAIWQSGNGPAADSSGSVYVITGNGTWDGETNFGESFLKLSNTLGLQDWHTPTDYANLNSGDLDLTASGPLLIPGTGLVIGGGKDGVLHLIKTGDMGHLGDAGAVQNWQATSSHIHSMNYWNGNLYLWGQSDYLRVYAFNGTTFNTTPKYKLSIQAIDHPGGSLSLSANGNSNGILWAATNTAAGDGSGAWHTTVPGILYAYDAGDMNLLWTSQQNAARDSCNYYAKFTAPTITNGKVYLASFGYAQTASGQLCVYGELPTTDLIPNGTYAIVSAYSGTAVDDPASSTANSTVMQIYTLNNGKNQQWTVNNLGNNIITLTNGASGQLLEVTGASTANSALVDQYPANGQTNQQWRVTSVGGTKYELTNVNSGLVLDIDGASKANKTQLDQYPYQANLWQQWSFQTN
jgi:outer membrane protein assembly factor BamB